MNTCFPKSCYSHKAWLLFESFALSSRPHTMDGQEYTRTLCCFYNFKHTLDTLSIYMFVRNGRYSSIIQMQMFRKPSCSVLIPHHC